MSSIFISHSSADNAEALALRDWLRTHGWDDLFLDIDPKRGLVAGQRWLDALADAGSRAKAVLFVLTPQWLESQYCKAEFFSAKEKGKALFGVIAAPMDLSDAPSEMTAVWQLADLTKGSEFEHFRVAAPPDYERLEIRFGKEGLESLRQGLLREGLGSLETKSFRWPSPGFETESDGTPRAPWRGLQAIDEPDAGVFFGRDGDLHRAMDTLAELRRGGGGRLVVILGASGSGKSSFLRAGLLPRLKRLDRDYCVLPIVRPEGAAINGRHGLLSSLVLSLSAAGVAVARAAIRGELEAASGALSQRLSQIQSAAAKSFEKELKAPTLILPLDQAEELFQPGVTETESFIAALAETLRYGPETLVIATIRTDTYAPLQSSTALRELQVTFSLPPIGRSDYRSTIEGPATRLEEIGRELIVVPTLIDRLVSEAEGGDALPLLAFTLERLYRDYGGDGRIDEADYEALRGMRGAVEAAVETAFANPDQTPRIPADPGERMELLQGALPWLVGINEANETALRRVAPWDKIPADSQGLIERLINQRLLRSDVGENDRRIVEIAHEALLRQWPSIQTWLDREADHLRGVQAVERAAAEWQSNGQASAWLAHRAERLTTAESLVANRPDLTARWEAKGQAYLSACRSAENAEIDAEKARQQQLLDEQRRRADAEREAAQRKTRQFRWAASLAATALLLAGVAVWLFFAARTSERAALNNEAQALYNEAHALAALSESMRASDPVLALKLALAAWPRSESDTYPRIEPAIAAFRKALPEAPQASHQRVILQHQKSKLYAAAFSPDGTRVAAASDDKTRGIWIAQTGEKIAVLSDHQFHNAAFSPDGTRVVTASTDKTARIWNAQTGDEDLVLKGHKQAVISAVFSPNGKSVLTASFDRTWRLWDSKNGEQLLIVDNNLAYDPVGMFHNPYNGAVFSPDGGRVATPGGDGKVRIWDAATGDLITVLAGHSSTVLSAAYSPDGGRLVTASGGTASVWNVDAGEVIGVLSGNDRTILSAAFSPDGLRVVTAHIDGTARVWDVASGAEIIVLTGHTKGLSGAAFAPDGNQIVTVSRDGSARLWKMPTEIRSVVLDNGLKTLSATFSHDSSRLVTTGDDGTARVWHPRREDEVAVLRSKDSSVLSAVFSSDGNRVLTASNDGSVRLWDSANGTELSAFIGHGGAAVGAVFSPEGFRVLTASDGGSARLQTTDTGAEIAVLRGHERRIRGAAFSPDGERILTVADDGTARLWDVATSAEIAVLLGYNPKNVQRELSGHKGTWVLDAKLSPKGDRVVTLPSGFGTSRLWDAATGALITELGGEITAFSPSGIQVLTSSQCWASKCERGVQIWDAATGEEIAELCCHEKGIDDAAFSPDEASVATASADKTVKIWDISTKKAVAVLQHQGSVNSVRFSPDGSVVATASDDGRTRLWDVAAGIEIASHTLSGPVKTATFSPDGKFVVSISVSGKAALWVAEKRGDSRWLRPGSAVNQAVLSSDGTRVVTTSFEGRVRLYEAVSGTEIAAQWGSSNFESITLSPDGGRLVTLAMDGAATLWDAAIGSQIANICCHENDFSADTFSQDGSRFVTKEGDTAWIWDAVTGAEINVLRLNGSSKFLAVKLSPDGSRIVTDESDVVRIRDATTGDVIETLHNTEAAFRGLYGFVFSPDGSRLAGIVNADRGGVTRLWNTDTGAQLAEVCCQTQSGQLPLFSPDGSIVLAVSMDPKNGQLVALDADSGAEIKVLCCVYGYTDFIAFSPNGAYLAIPSYNGKPARIWNTQTWSEIAILPYESARIDSRIRFSPDNSRLITTSGDGKPRLWDTATAAEIAVLRGHRGSIRTAEFSPNMNRVLTTSDDGTARLWDISGIKGQSAFEIACQRLSDREFTDAEQKFGVDIDRPICEGKPPLP